MTYSCELIRDLLPLYKDEVCSQESRRAVEEHIADCSVCAGLLSRLGDGAIEETIEKEKGEVISRQAKFFRRKSAFVGAVVAAIFMLPILVCLIVDLASGAGLSWFFIVLASLLVAASLIIVPLMVSENRWLWTITAFTASLLILLAVYCIYTGGRWYFVAATASLFGLAAVFLPFVVRARPVAGRLGENKGVKVMLTDTGLFILMMVCIGLYVRSALYWSIALAVSLPLMILAWVIFALIRFPRYNGLIKAGTCCAVVGIFGFFTGPAIDVLMGRPAGIPAFSPFIWNAFTIDGNVVWAVLIAGILAGAVLAIIGLIKEGRKTK